MCRQQLPAAMIAATFSAAAFAAPALAADAGQHLLNKSMSDAARQIAMSRQQKISRIHHSEGHP